MAVLLPGLALLLLLMLFRVRQRSLFKPSIGPAAAIALGDWRYAWITSMVAWGLLITAVTELLSLVHQIQYSSLVTVWLLINLGLGGWLITRWARVRRSLFSQSGRVIIDDTQKLLACAIITIAAVTLVIAWQSAPNNGDAMTYALPRIRHWIQYRAVMHYPVHYTLQLFSEPWAEYVLLQWQVLSHGDRWANLLQWGCMISSLIGVSLIAKQLGASQTGQWLTALLAATIPVGIMHSTTPRNTYVVAFWLICLVVYTLRIVTDRPNRSALFGATCSLGLAVLSKGTAYIYALPFVLWLLGVYWQRYGFRIIKYVLMTWPVFGLISLGHYARNWMTFGSLISTDPYKLSNDIYTLPGFISGLVKNVALHCTVPVFDSDWVLQLVTQIHHWIGISPLDPRLNFYGVADIYQPAQFALNMLPLAEDRTTNPLHFWLFLAALGLLFMASRWKSQKLVVQYAVMTTSAFLLFCFLVKWQIWHGRLHLPVFLLACPVIALSLTRYTQRQFCHVLIVVLWAASLPYLGLNEMRPIAAVPNIFSTPRLSQYFQGREDSAFEQSYADAANLVAQNQCFEIGLIMLPNSFEYPLWKLLDQVLPQPFQMQHVNVDNQSSRWANQLEFRDFHPCAVVVMGLSSPPQITVNQQTYQHVWSGPAIAGGLQVFQPASSRPAAA
ncbi:glycosyltransferase family 39 protein [filamentous cyanobacterium LEGE 11480]|uniref:Glycosyltransferase family 39 protein n=1 Tax=Romeriopsis navalis LEGE 11480 TaxID=2777977 RepID=A0A928VLG9_9CYAN|nr:glycosyltransferase family 39 protein [Romeriopsis navalis]MBE9030741.1 glycosyltransferase family 39 protein [Romeriopsis navalis LEGE 11480]